MARPQKYPVRVNLRISEETHDAFKAAAEVLETDVTGLIREYLNGGVPSMQMIAQAFESMKAGQVVAGASLVAAMMDSLMAQGEASRQQMHAIRDQVAAQTKSA